MRFLIVIFVLLVTSTATAQTRSSVYVLSESETSTFYGGFQYAMENSQDHQVVDWLTPATGLNGTTVAIKTYRTVSGQYCREYLATIQFGTAVQQSYGTACRQPDANWRVADERLVKRQNPQLRFAVVNKSRQHSCSHTQSRQSKTVQSLQRHQHFHSDRFHEQLRQMERGGQPAPKTRQMEKRHPSKLLKLVAN